MKKLYIAKIRLFIFLVGITMSKLCFGSSNCPIPTLHDVQFPGDINEYTLYNYIKSYINISCPVDANALTAANNTMKINFVQNGRTTTISAPLDSTFKLSEVPSDLAQNIQVKNILMSVDDFGGMICLSMNSVYGKLGLFCQNKSQTQASISTSRPCNAYDSCFKGPSKSMLSFGFSGLAVECIRNSLYNILFSDSFSCGFIPERDAKREVLLNPVSVFQKNMKQFVSAFLILYVMIYGFKMALEPQQRTPQEMVLAIIKMIVVTYFAVGASMSTFSNKTYSLQETNGMQEYGLPLLLSAMDSFSQIVINATSKGQYCNFNNLPYPPGYGYYALWDSIDCRLGKILFISPSSNHSFLGVGILAPLMIIKFILSGQIVAALCILIMVYLFFRMCLKFISTYIMLVVTIFGLSYFSSLFIPTVLFEKTRHYFDSWLRLLISAALQPMVIAGFMVVMLNIFDSTMYGGCKFERLQDTSGASSKYYFKITNPEDASCNGSVGYELEQYYSNKSSWLDVTFFIMATTIPKQFKNLVGILTFTFWIIIFWFLFDQANNFAAEITGGISVGDISISSLSDLKSSSGGEDTKANKKKKPNEKSEKQGKDSIKTDSGTKAADQVGTK